MDLKIEPKKLSGKLTAVSSKSDAHRKIIAAALADRETEIVLNAFSDDIYATLGCIKNLGGLWEKTDAGVVITPIKKTGNSVNLDFCESGSTARFLLPVTAALYPKGNFGGQGRLVKRPFYEIVREMRLHGVKVDSDLLPMFTDGCLTGGKFTLSGDVSSQFTTGLLYALPLLRGGGEIVLTSPLQSEAYVEMTVDTLKEFGVCVNRTEHGFEVDEQIYKSPGKTYAEGDWSNAAFWIVADKIGDGITVDGLNKSSRQGDKIITDIVDQTEIDCSQIPDLAPILAVLASARNVTTVIYNAARLRLKESDRIKSVCAMINSLGGNAEEFADKIVINGCGTLRGGIVDGFNDHRIVMSAAIASCICTEPVVIRGAEAVNKSYPLFFEDFKSMGGSVCTV